MADRDHDEEGRGGPRDLGLDRERNWRGERSPRDINDREGPAERFGGDRGRSEAGRPQPRTFGGGRSHGSDVSERSHGEGGDSGHGQMAGGSFRPAGFDANAYDRSPRGGAAPGGETPHDPHHASYHHWRDTQLSSHDRDYARWRDEQARRYDEDYGSWRNERHSAFSKEFEGWRAGRGGQAGVPASAQAETSTGEVASSNAVNPSEASVYGQTAPKAPTAGLGSAHGANPTLARIADGDSGHSHHDSPDKSEIDSDPLHH